MAHLTYSTGYPGYGESAKKNYWYSQSVRVGDRIECSGQGGWNRDTTEISTDLTTEIDQAFENVDVTVKAAGGKGWESVYRVNTYHVCGSDPIPLEIMVNALKKWCPNHQPIWTNNGVTKLGLPDMRVEVEVVAHVES